MILLLLLLLLLQLLLINTITFINLFLSLLLIAACFLMGIKLIGSSLSFIITIIIILILIIISVCFWSITLLSRVILIKSRNSIHPLYVLNTLIASFFVLIFLILYLLHGCFFDVI